MALTALRSAAAVVRLGITRSSGLAFDIAIEARLLSPRGAPRAHIPDHTGETFQLEAFALPFPARLAGTVKCS